MMFGVVREPEANDGVHGAWRKDDEGSVGAVFSCVSNVVDDG